MQIKASGKTYELGELSLGEFRILKREFGVARLDEVHPADPDVIVGLTVLAMHRAEPDVPLDVLTRRVEALTTIEVIADDAGDEDEDPTAGASGASSSGSEPGSGDGEHAG